MAKSLMRGWPAGHSRMEKCCNFSTFSSFIFFTISLFWSSRLIAAIRTLFSQLEPYLLSKSRLFVRDLWEIGFQLVQKWIKRIYPSPWLIFVLEAEFTLSIES
jgi:hypothetical protein